MRLLFTLNVAVCFRGGALLLGSCSLFIILRDTTYAKNAPMPHVILLGDSIFDNGAYVGVNPDVRQQTEQALLAANAKVTLLARDGAVIADVAQQLRGLPKDATHLVVSAGGNDALREAGVLDARASSVSEALYKLAVVGDSFSNEAMLDELTSAGLPTA